MMPVAALVGHPNVGKPILFSRLTCTRDALVADLPGLTRDRGYGCAEIEGRESICIDTGSIDGTGDDIEIRMAEQSPLAIGETDVMLLTVDARAGLMPVDGTIAKHLRSHQEPVFLIVNKIGGLDPDQAVVDFYSLSPGEIYPVATPHGHGTLSLLEHILLSWVNDVAPQGEVDEDTGRWVQLEAKKNGEEEPEDDFSPRDLSIELAVVDRPSIDKSMLTSRVLGEDRIVAYDMPGTTRSSIYTPVQRDEREYVLIDTADVREHGKITEVVEKFSVIKTLQAIEGTSAVMPVIDTRRGTPDQDLSLLGFIPNNGRSPVIVVNKWDGLMQEVKEQVRETLDFHLGFADFAHVHFISVLRGSGVGNLLELAYEVYDSSTRHVNTVMLTRIVTMAVEDHQPPLVRSRRVRLKYAHAGGYNPPIAMIHGNQVRDLPDSYKRYLMNYLRKSLDAIGTSIHIQFEERENPFVNKRNTLTLAQMRKRKHLIKCIKKSE